MCRHGDPYRRGIGAAGEIPDQTQGGGSVFAGDDNRLIHPVAAGQRSLHVTEFDAIPANLDLLIGTPQVPQLAVGIPSHQIPGPIHPRSGAAERACDETRRTQARPAQVTHTQTGAGHEQLTDHADRNRPQRTVEHEQRRSRHRRTDRHHTGSRAQRRTDRHAHRGFRWAVGIDHHPSRRPAVHHFGRTRLADDDQRRRLQPFRRQRRHRRRRLGQHRDALCHQHRLQILRRPRHRIRNHHNPAAAQQRAEDLPHRHIESR